MNFLKRIASGAGKFVIGFDIFTGNILPRWLFSGFAKRDPNETISSKLGKEQAVLLYNEWDKSSKTYYPFIPLHHPLGQISAALCECFQHYHALRSITWDCGVDIERGRPGIKGEVQVYLKMHGTA